MSSLLSYGLIDWAQVDPRMPGQMWGDPEVRYSLLIPEGDRKDREGAGNPKARSLTLLLLSY